jgi:hypothetical protein
MKSQTIAKRDPHDPSTAKVIPERKLPIVIRKSKMK